MNLRIWLQTIKTSVGLTGKLLLILIACSIFVILLPGAVAYRNNVYYGSMFKDRIPDSVIISRLQASEMAQKRYAHGKLTDVIDPSKAVTITFSGFADRAYKYVWLETYIILCLYAFVLYGGYVSGLVNRKTLLLGIAVFLLFHTSTWIRNVGEFGEYGITVYSYTNFQIDKMSFFIQELRTLGFAMLIAIFWRKFEIRFCIARKSLRYSIKNFGAGGILKLGTQSRTYFNYWQRDLFITILLFLPWTWRYWRSIYIYGDSRYLFQAIVFHLFWIISIILISRPFYILYFNYWNYRNRLTFASVQNGTYSQSQAYLNDIDPFPKGQFLFTSALTLLSLLSPFLQMFLDVK